MTPAVETQSFNPNPRRPKPECRTLTMHTDLIRKKTYEIERLADRARGNGSRARIAKAVMDAERLLVDVLASEGRFIAARESYEDSAALAMGGLDVLA